MFYVLADEGIVAYKDLDGQDTAYRSIVGRSLRPVAVAYDPVEQVHCRDCLADIHIDRIFLESCFVL